jgi:Fe-S cluster biogenesis protein NfuA
MEEKIRKIISEKINPVLAQHFGGAELVEIIGKTVYIRMNGACGACPSSQITLKSIIEAAIREEMPEIEEVCLYQGVSDDMIDFAKKLIKSERDKESAH